ncbi:DUF7310 family coiled-coil domain-containing protein [Halegenticoccus tardaugens]|uniref:DUF7310 family coiled-coil domain-containing protein n=1 Tax=Halegenticoccus tardaugens TaxID=2071624 RepID=UPI00100ABAF3|nr:hypothetical protein [Halegenticoccus tardaugens]
MDDTALAERLAAVERALTEGSTDLSDVSDAAARDDRVADLEATVERLDDRVADLEATVERLDDRVADLEAATMAVRGYVGGIRAVNRDVERRADAALAKVEALEAARDGDRRGDAFDAVAAEIDEHSIEAAGESDRDGDGEPDGDDEPDGEVGGEATLAARLRDAL